MKEAEAAITSELHASVNAAAFELIDDPDETSQITHASRMQPQRMLSRREKALLRQEGLIVIRRFISDSSLLRSLEKAALRSQAEPFWHVALRNKGIWAWIRHGPLGSIAASALDTDVVRLQYSAVWVKEPLESGFQPSGAWHRDLHASDSNSEPMIKAWVALTDAPGAMEWVVGSHKLSHSCPNVQPTQLSLGIDPKCLESIFARKTAEGLIAKRIYNLSKGDIIIFDSRIWHRGWSSFQQRIALDFSFVPRSQKFEGALALDFFYRSAYHFAVPKLCDVVSGPLFPIVYPDALLTSEDTTWPLIPSKLEFKLGQLQQNHLDARWKYHGYKLPRCAMNGSIRFDGDL
eukprot:TRINITY_DN72407_c0_g1_i1.p1 TRINITY_DN72407_c0_g1~~TRINITY_DN72407_c0_g1_i1.p1  ORF type:complete len:382 (-),score=28.02 TRINITY_DN72407_c0_g1_i1:625-1668(-)